MQLRPRDGLIFLAGILIGMVLSPATIFAQGLTQAGAATTLPVDSQGTAAALTKFLTDIGRRMWGGGTKAPGWAPLVLAAIFGPIITAVLAIAAGINLIDGPTVAKVLIGGLLAATGGAALLTAMHDVSREPSANIPPALAGVPAQQRAQLCCLHDDCRTVQMASVQVASGQPAVPVEASVPVPTSPPQAPPANPPSGPGVGIVDQSTSSVPPPMRR